MPPVETAARAAEAFGLEKGIVYEAARLLREDGHSLRAIGGALGVSDHTVRNDLSAAPEGAPPDRVTGQDGKSYPARRPTVTAAKNLREAVTCA